MFTPTTLMPTRTLSVDSLTVHIYSSAAAVAFAASCHAAEILSRAMASRGVARAVFATGRSQKQCLQYLTVREKTALDWRGVEGVH